MAEWPQIHNNFFSPTPLLLHRASIEFLYILCIVFSLPASQQSTPPWDRGSGRLQLWCLSPPLTRDMPFWAYGHIGCGGSGGCIEGCLLRGSKMRAYTRLVGIGSVGTTYSASWFGRVAWLWMNWVAGGWSDRRQDSRHILTPLFSPLVCYRYLRDNSLSSHSFADFIIHKQNYMQRRANIMHSCTPPRIRVGKRLTTFLFVLLVSVYTTCCLVLLLHIIAEKRANHVGKKHDDSLFTIYEDTFNHYRSLDKINQALPNYNEYLINSSLSIPSLHHMERMSLRKAVILQSKWWIREFQLCIEEHRPCFLWNLLQLTYPMLVLS